ncbi:unnamed protein product [Clavelina lepadiformis]|uniref:PH domain-containing protein n=1 Tax=Clavelina lepadiformis TaxID=159417 RepID=A0ABP0EYJ0_CLALP
MEPNPRAFNPQTSGFYPALTSAPSLNDTNDLQPPPYSPSSTEQSTFSPNQQPPILSQQQHMSQGASSLSQPVMQPVTIPLRCKSGNVEIGIGDNADTEKIRYWKGQYIEVQDGVLRIAASRKTRNQHQTISLSNHYIAKEAKKMVALYGNPKVYVIKSSSEVRAHEWLLALSQYCYIAPIMEGYCDKMSRGKKVWEERFVRLNANGVVSWYRSDHEDSELKGAVQVRGEPCSLDAVNPTIIHIKVDAKGYQFRFDSPREAALWLAAFSWHVKRKPLRKSSIPIRNNSK